jgi:hypothetical protein
LGLMRGPIAKDQHNFGKLYDSRAVATLKATF